MRTWLFYKLTGNLLPFEWWYDLIHYIRYEWCWIDEDHCDDY